MAAAAELPKQASSDIARCGASSREAIAIAEKALAEKSADSEAIAIACLIAAVKRLEAERLDAVRGKDKSRVLHVPSTR